MGGESKTISREDAKHAKARIDFCRHWRQKQPILSELRELLFKLFSSLVMDGRRVLNRSSQRTRRGGIGTVPGEAGTGEENVAAFVILEYQN